MKALFDTNILIDHLHGVEAATNELDRYDQVAVSRIVWIEFLVKAKTREIESERRNLLHRFELIEVDTAISEETVLVRNRTRLLLPDAIILATARIRGLLLITRNHRDFSRHEPNIRIPY